MTKTTLVGLIIVILFVVTMTGIVFSKIQIEPVFTSGQSGTTALTSVGGNFTSFSLLDVIILHPIGNWISSINPFNPANW